MKPLRLEIENLNSFTDTQTVDFSAFSADRLFCICGDTGAGKTTVLDAVIIALYGIKERTADTRSGKDDFINLNADKARVLFEFEYGGTVWRAERIYNRSGASKAYLYESDKLVCSDVTSVNERLQALVGLEREQFTQVIILQQGMFSKFLTAKPTERTETVSKLFKLERFDLYSRIHKLAAECETEVRVLDGELKQYGAINGETIAAAKRELRALAKSIGEADEAIAAAEKERDALRERARKYETYQKASAAARALEEALAVRNGEYRAFVEKTGDAEKLAQALSDAETRMRESEAAQEDFERRRERALTHAQLKKSLEDLRAAFKNAAAEEKRLLAEKAEKTAEVERVRSELSGIASDLQAAQEQLEGTFPKDYNELSRFCSAACARLETEARSYAEKAAEREQAEKDLAVWTAAAAENLKAAAALKTEYAAAEAAYARERRNSAAAAVLEGLSEGDECPVCGGIVRKRAIVEEVDAARSRWEELGVKLRKLESAQAVYAEKTAAAERDAKAPLAPPADAHPYKTMADLAGRAAAAEKERDALEAAIAVLATRLETCAANKAQLEERGKETGKSCEREAEAAGDYRDTPPEALARLSESFAAEKRKTAEAFRLLTEQARESENTRARLENEKARLEGEYAAALQACVPADPVPEGALHAADRLLSARKEARDEAIGKETALKERIVRDGEGWERKKKLEAERAGKNAKGETAKQLAGLMKDKALVKFVAEEYIRGFTDIASARLSELSGGKYTLAYRDGAFCICDFLNGNSERRVVTLSGGETFLASLSMAAAISDVLAENKSYGFFFLDEGFGTLDPTKIDSVYEALLKLSADTLVGVVTHSAELLERIPAKLTVLPAAAGKGSVIV